jgi:hypothetical protein
MADPRDKSDYLAKRDFSPVTTVPDNSRKEVVVWGVRIEHDLS